MLNYQTTLNFNSSLADNDLRLESFLADVEFDVMGNRASFAAVISVDRILQIVREANPLIKTQFYMVLTASSGTRNYQFFFSSHAAVNPYQKVGAGIINITKSLDESAEFNVPGHSFGAIEAYGERGYVQEIYNAATSLIGRVKQPKIIWHYINSGSHDSTVIPLPSWNDIYDEFYPFIGTPRYDGAKDMLKKYLDSNESILILLGPPGTGKSSLLRYMIGEYSLSASITYDEDIIKSDRIFLNHLTSDTSDVLILEDSDLILEGRATSQNRVMNRLLNVSDGIVQVIEKKKLIFTANLPAIDSIDDALLRPGRCFDIIEFRDLTFSEAERAAKVIGVAGPTEDRKRMSLSELFNGKDNRDGTQFTKKRRVGF